MIDDLLLKESKRIEPEYLLDSETSIEAAKAEGFEVLVAGPNDLFIDIDDLPAYETFQRCFDILIRYKVAEIVFDRSSTSGLPHRHIHVRILGEPLTPWQRLAFECAMASDPVRSLLNCLRLDVSDPVVSLFFGKAPAP
jgi:hypothetical protein